MGILVCLAAVTPWVLFSLGGLSTWPGPFHMLAITQAGFTAFIAGFLGTLLPRRIGAPVLAGWQLYTVVIGLVLVPVAMSMGALAVAESAFLVAAAILTRQAWGCWRRFAPGRGLLPPSFLLVPVALLAAQVGAVLLIVTAREGGSMSPTPVGELGRMLSTQGLLIGVVLAIVPMLGPIVIHGRPPGLDPRHHARQRALYAGLGVLLLASFVVEVQPGMARLGLLLRGGVIASGLALTEGVWKTATAPGFHRALMRVSLLLLPLGTLLAGAAPAYRAALLHVSFIGGLGLMVLAVSSHVTMMHSEHAILAGRRPALLIVATGALLVAMLARVFAELHPEQILRSLTIAAIAWLVGVGAWAAFVLPKLRAPRPPRPPA